MSKLLMSLLFLVAYVVVIYANPAPTNDSTDSHDAQAQAASPTTNYISTQAYLQNPYIEMPSGGGTQNVQESEYARDNVAQKWFADGTWNIFGAGSYINQNGYNNYGYAANIFGQTKQVAGFSFGGLLTIANVFFSNDLNPSEPTNQAQGLPIEHQVTPQELFAEYQYSNIVQVDAGWLGISNSPWMTYYQNDTLNMVTYQGILANVHPGSGWLLTGFAINGAQLPGEDGFSGQTMYNSTWNTGTSTGNIGNASNSYTYAFGANWTSPQQLVNARLWGYAFADYANMAYADTTIKLPINNNLGFNIGVQGALQGQNGSSNILNTNGYGNSVDSHMIGLQFGFNYSIFNLQLGYNNIWGNADGYEAGGIVSPYTYQLATDPLYTTGWIQGMVERSSGQAYKIAPSLSLLDNNLTIAPAYQYYATTLIPASSEYDLQISYNVPQIKGLTFFGGYGYLTDINNDGSGIYQWQIMVTYLY
ncbi:MAG: hypothetical protein K0R49_1610 [Burkholderiales bacterium]|nr:hypothetical protein [Burkholderiales bacterium]